jgi:hypothetical protein
VVLVPVPPSPEADARLKAVLELLAKLGRMDS